MTHVTHGNTPAEQRLNLAVKAARAAGAETLRWFRQATLSVEHKGDGSPVTAADRAAETQKAGRKTGPIAQREEQRRPRSHRGR